MPKMKTKAGAKKRFKVTGSGKIKKTCIQIAYSYKKRN
jgi:ribosomal protein L35